MITVAQKHHYAGVLFEAMIKRGIAEAVSRGPDGLPNEIIRTSDDLKLNAEAFEEAARLTGITIDVGKGWVREMFGGNA